MILLRTSKYNNFEFKKNYFYNPVGKFTYWDNTYAYITINGFFIRKDTTYWRYNRYLL